MRPLVAILWGAFALLVIWIGGEFLFACEARLASLVWNTCPASNQRLLEESERSRALQREIHAAEMSLAQKPVCEPVAETKIDPQTKREAYSRGAKPGRLEIFLTWHTLDDIDLEISCPGGKLGGQAGASGPGICGDGRVDLDANKNLKENIQSDPIEHAVWRDEIPAGLYRFKAHLFMAKDSSREREIPFEMTIILDGKQRTCSGSLPFYPANDRRKAQNGGILATRTASIVWRSGDGLPDCEWNWDEATFCNGSCPKP